MHLVKTTNKIKINFISNIEQKQNLKRFYTKKRIKENTYKLKNPKQNK